MTASVAETTAADPVAVDADTEWVPVAALERLPVDRGVAALVAGEPVAVFRLLDGTLAAIDHVEPFGGAPVLARGLVGSADDTVYVASPLHKQRFCLRTGACLDDPAVAVRSWPVCLRDGWVYVATQPVTDP